MAPPPLPPPDLARRVGVLDQDDPLPSFDDLGGRLREILVGFQPADWFTGKRILDFGCGPGKVLRHFSAEAERCEILGCDIHEPSVRWVKENLDRVEAFVCGEAPPLPLPSEHLDLVWAMSVFTHVTGAWAEWLIELHRVLAPGGRLVATFLGEGMSESIAGEPWDPNRVGMSVLRAWQSWDEGGPSVQHSEWWLREHWGRAFDVERVQDGPELGHGWIVLTKRPVSLTPAELTRPSADPRELTAVSHNLSRALAEAIELGDSRRGFMARLDAAEREASATRDELSGILSSRAWRAAKAARSIVRP
jgi:SAM-dependent methyltransferase